MQDFEITYTVGKSAVRIYTRDTGAHGKIHGAYLDQVGPEGSWRMCSWFSNGFFHPFNADEGTQHKCSMDLLESITKQAIVT